MLCISEEALKSEYYVNEICGVSSNGKFTASHVSLLKLKLARNRELET